MTSLMIIFCLLIKANFRLLYFVSWDLIFSLLLKELSRIFNSMVRLDISNLIKPRKIWWDERNVKTKSLPKYSKENSIISRRFSSSKFFSKKTFSLWLIAFLVGKYFGQKRRIKRIKLVYSFETIYCSRNTLENHLFWILSR